MTVHVEERELAGPVTVDSRVRRGRPRPGVPAVSPTYWRWFTWYARRHLRRHFHAVRLDLDGFDPSPCAVGRDAATSHEAPLIIYMNHPSWWDPMVALFLASHVWPGRKHFAPIDARMLEKYRFFRKLGFFGVDQASGTLGAADFVRTSTEVLSEPGACLWVTAGGEFADVRRRPLQLKPGVAHLARRLSGGLILPLAIEYTFWTESTAEVLLRFGQPVSLASGDGAPARAWHARLESHLEREMDRLAARAKTRDPSSFQVLLSGASGTSAFYDAWRWLRARVGGRQFDRAHMPEAPKPDRRDRGGDAVLDEGRSP